MNELDKYKNFSINEDAFCEHCGKLEKFDITWEDNDEITWCLDCASTFSEFKLKKEDYNELLKIQKQKRIEYHENQLALLKKI